MRTLAVIEFEQSHTAYYLHEVINDVLTDYNLSAENVYTTTTDNGSNMVKLSTLIEEGHDLIFPDFTNMEEEFKYGGDENLEESGELDKDEDEGEDEDGGNNESNGNENFLNSNEIGGSKLDDLDKKLENEFASEGIHEGVRCATHTRQLTLWDVLKKIKYKKAIAKLCYTIYHKLHDQTSISI